MKTLQFIFGKRIGEAAYVSWNTDGWKGKLDTSFLCVLYANILIDFLILITK